MAPVSQIFERTLRKFETRERLDEADRQALYDLPYELRIIEPNRYIVREGDRPIGVNLIVDGLAFRQKLTVEGARQILSVHIPGDFVDLEGSLLRFADHNVQALTRCEVAIVPREAIVALIRSRARIAHAMWIDSLIDGSIYREWIVNVGRRSSRAAMCHLLCEFARRLEATGLGNALGYELPMSQEQLGDALGITPVHVNRILRDLDREGLINREKRFMRVPNWEALRKVGGFNDNYLHLDQVVAKRPLAASS